MSAKALLSASVSAGPAAYVEDVFSTYLYTGNNSTQTITNGIDLAGEGGLVWTKGRTGTQNNRLIDTTRGSDKLLTSNDTGAEAAGTAGYNITAFNSDGYTLGLNEYSLNSNGSSYASWTFRKAEKFFDVVTWTGNGTSGRAIPHNLGSAPGFIAVKITSSVDNWECYHRGVTFNSGNVLWLNSENPLTTGGPRFTSAPDATNFYVGSDSGVNGSGQTYVAYLFAHDAGGFGDAGTDSVVSCGSVVGSSQVEVNLGWEPQWILVKNASSAQDWWLVDNMRGLPVQGTDTSYNASNLRPNLSDAETTGFSIAPSATGFKANVLSSGQTYIYIAIRRGPMRTPTVGTTVFNTQAGTYSSLGTLTAADMVLFKGTSNNGQTAGQITDRVRGFRPLSDWTTGTTSTSPFLSPSSTDAESTSNSYTGTEPIGLNVFGNKNAPVSVGYGSPNSGSASAVNYSFRRAPGFFDVVAYTGTGVGGRTVAHNLTVAPEMIIAKNRSGATNLWLVYTQPTGASGVLQLHSNAALVTPYFDWVPTSTTFSVGAQGFGTNDSGINYVSYLFATAPGVSKVGSYTGTGTTLSIDCGFTAGARFILIKRTDSTGDWYVWDTARGIISGDDPYLLLNSTAAEVTNTDYIDPLSSGFQISSTAPAAINASGGSFIFLAIA